MALVVWLVVTGIPTVAVSGVGIWWYRHVRRKDTASGCQVFAAIGTLVLGVLMAVVMALGALLMVP